MTSSSHMQGSLDIESIRARHFGSYTHKYTHRDVILYALALGCKAEDLQHIYEHHPSFSPLPTFAIIAAHPCLASVPLEHFIPGFDRSRALHGEQYLRVLAPLPSHGHLITEPKLVDLQDKGKNAVMVVRSLTRDAQLGHVIAENEFVIYGLGAGGFGSPWPPAPRPAAACATNRPPQRPPDTEVLVTTSAEQAALYRLCGDYNPLHIDPAVAKKVGFPKPILHGLCTMGMSVKAVVEAMANGDFSRLRTAKVRFSKPCLPGDTLRVRMWWEGATSPHSAHSSATPTHAASSRPQPALQRVVFETSVVGSGATGEREVVVINGAAVEFEELAQQAKL